MNIYITEQYMSDAEVNAFTDEIADYLIEDIEAGGNQDVDEAMDEMGVPAYDDVCG